MKIAHTKTGMRLHLTDSEFNALKKLGNNPSLAIMPKSDDRFLEFRPYDPAWGRTPLFSMNPRMKSTPWQIDIRDNRFAVLRAIARFGAEETTLTYEGNHSPPTVVVRRPPMQQEIRVVSQQNRGRKKTSKILSAKTAGDIFAEKHNSNLPRQSTSVAATISAAEIIPAPGSGIKFSLRSAVELINRYKSELGEDLALSVTRTGKLSALIQLGEED